MKVLPLIAIFTGVVFSYRENYCYCPGEPLLNDKPLRDKLYDLQEDLKLTKMERFVTPKTNVPNIEILQIMFPNLTFPDLLRIDEEKLINMISIQRDNYKQRLETRNITGYGIFPSGIKQRKKRASSSSEYSYYQLKSLDFNKTIWGIKPERNESLIGAQLCQCPDNIHRVRRRILMENITWNDDFFDSNSQMFQKLKVDAETKLNEIFGNINGYFGSSLIQIELRVSPSTTEFIKDLELIFTFFDDTMETIINQKLSNNLNFSLDGQNRTCDLANLKSPSFLRLENSPSNYSIYSGDILTFICGNTSLAIPTHYDPDSNWKLEIRCSEGQFKFPNKLMTWPNNCIEHKFCSLDDVSNDFLKTPPTSITRLTELKSRYRIGERIYFTCKEPKAIFDNGLRVSNFRCSSNLTIEEKIWPKCNVEPRCENWTKPDENATGLKFIHDKDFLLAGETAKFICLKTFHWMKNIKNRELVVYCHEGRLLNVPSVWPVCEHVPCVCVGDPLLNSDENINILGVSCPHTSNFIDHKTYITPKRDFCGSYLPKNPTTQSQCVCEDTKPKAFWIEIKIQTSFLWSEGLSNPYSPIYYKRKEMIEKGLNEFFHTWSYTYDNRYMRSILVSFRKGQKTLSGRYDVLATVETHFRSSTKLEVEEFKQNFSARLKGMSGTISSTLKADDAYTVVTDVKVCRENKLNAVLTSRHNVVYPDPNLKRCRVGDFVRVHCKYSKLFRLKIEGSNDKDEGEYLTIYCKPDLEYDIPSNIPDCSALCPAEKPVPPEGNRLILHPTRSSPSMRLWEGERLWYICERKTDGFAELIPNKNVEEGGFRREISYPCSSSGEYSVPSPPDRFPRCIPKGKRCRCVGDFSSTNMSLEVLQRYCRHQKYRVVDSAKKDSITGKFYPLIFPSKNRCGTLDPTNMTKDNGCFCATSDKNGARDAHWLTIELFNVPWSDSLFDANSAKFRFAKKLLEEKLDTVFFGNEEIFRSKFVRTIVVQFRRGVKYLKELRNSTLASAKSGTRKLKEIPGFLGEPIIPGLNRDLGDNETEVGTIAVIEFQFVQQVFQNLKNITQDFIKGGWLGDTFWVENDCFEKRNCSFEPIKRCDNRVLELVKGLGFTHDNFIKETAKLEKGVPIGSTVNLVCDNPSKRITQDRWDDNPEDHKISITCQANASFTFPSIEEFPTCQFWCTKKKPVPPDYSGLELEKSHQNDREYWFGESLTYICKDTSLGVDASSSPSVDFTCWTNKPFTPAKFSVPNENETWPICQSRTTTVSPAIKIAVDQTLIEFAKRLVDRLTLERYYSSDSSDEPNYWVIMTLPALLCLSIIVFVILCCTRYDNPLCKFCATEKTLLH